MERDNFDRQCPDSRERDFIPFIFTTVEGNKINLQRKD